jgi:glycosyltransferase involved in cell wall biosynthesis
MRSAVFAAPAAKLARVKFVWHVRDLHRERLFLRTMSALADAIIANSEAVANTVRPFAAHKVTVVYNGVTLTDYVAEPGSRAALRAELGLSDSNPLLGNIGWFAPWKGQDEFVAVAKQVAARCPDARFVVVGAATDERYQSYEQQIRTQARDRIGNRLNFLGARSPLTPVLAGLDILVHCAENEPFGRVLIEAMAMERPVIAFGGGGPDEIIEHGVSGLLIPPHDVDQMAQAAAELADQPERRASMGRAARACVEQRFDSRVSAQRVQQIYESIV